MGNRRFMQRSNRSGWEIVFEFMKNVFSKIEQESDSPKARELAKTYVDKFEKECRELRQRKIYL